MSPRVGHRWLCIRDLVMKNTGDIAYKKGKVYESEMNDAITDEEGNSFHMWVGKRSDELRRYYFKFIPKNKGITARLIYRAIRENQHNQSLI